MKWAEVEAHPNYQGLTPEQKETTRNAYFDEVVRPRIPPEALRQVREAFDRDTAPGVEAPAEPQRPFTERLKERAVKAFHTPIPVIGPAIQRFREYPQRIEEISRFAAERQWPQAAQTGITALGVVGELGTQLMPVPATVGEAALMAAIPVAGKGIATYAPRIPGVIGRGLGYDIAPAATAALRRLGLGERVAGIAPEIPPAPPPRLPKPGWFESAELERATFERPPAYQPPVYERPVFEGGLRQLPQAPPMPPRPPTTGVPLGLPGGYVPPPALLAPAPPGVGIPALGPRPERGLVVAPRVVPGEGFTMRGIPGAIPARGAGRPSVQRAIESRLGLQPELIPPEQVRLQPVTPAQAELPIGELPKPTRAATVRAVTGTMDTLKTALRNDTRREQIVNLILDPNSKATNAEIQKVGKVLNDLYWEAREQADLATARKYESVLERMGLRDPREAWQGPRAAPPPAAPPPAAPAPPPAPAEAPAPPPIEAPRPPIPEVGSLEATLGKPTWQATAQEWKAKLPDQDPQIHVRAILDAFQEGKPVSREVVKSYGLEDEVGKIADEQAFSAERAREIKAQFGTSTPMTEFAKTYPLSPDIKTRYAGEIQNLKGLRFDPASPNGLDTMASEMHQAGLLPTPDVNLMLRAMEHEATSGTPYFGARFAPGREYGISEGGLPETTWGREGEAGFARFGPIPEEPPRPPITVTEQLRSSVGRVQKRIDEVTRGLDDLNARAKIAIEQVAPIEAAGTFEKPVRPEFRKGGVPVSEADLRAYKMSANEAKRGMAEIVAAAREVSALKTQMQSQGDVLSANTAALVDQSLKQAIQRLNRAVEQANVQRFVTNRIIKSYDGPIPKDVIETLRSQNALLNTMKEVKERLPITTNIIEGIRNWGKLKPGERQQFWSDVVNQFRLNLFSPFSWTLDFIGNAAEIGAQTIGGFGHDLAHLLVRGKASMPATQGLFSILKAPRALKRQIEEAMGATVGGEIVRGGLGAKGGVFTMRATPLSKFYDYLVGTPLYLKGFFDVEAGKIAGIASVYRQAVMAADEAGLRGVSRVDFIRNFAENPSPAVLDIATEFAQKARFNRPLPASAERLAANPVMQIVVDAFPRWGFQFTKWAAEMLGYNKKLLADLRAGTATPEQAAEYLAKTATGWGGLYYLNETMYDGVDFNSMEYVDSQGGRSRLSGREPLTTALFLLAVMKGDQEKAAAALKFISVPGAKFLGGEGGMLFSTLSHLQRAARSREFNPRTFGQDFTNELNRAIPGQALLGMVKTAIDPVVRRGIGAGIPGVSQLLPPVIDPATGKPLTPMQETFLLPGVQFPSVLGTPIPGATRVLDPVTKLLFRYGKAIYKGPRTSILGIPASEIPEPMRDEWLTQLGQYRQRIFGPLVRNPQMLKRLEQMDFKDAQALISRMDTDAAQAASAVISAKYKAQPAILRRLAPKERALPARLMRPAIEAREAEEKLRRKGPTTEES